MSETKFTPGPWALEEFDEHGGYDCMTAGVACGPAKLDGHYYGQKTDGTGMDASAKARMMADAALIAAAPDLYEALGKCEAAIRAMGSNIAEFGTVTDVEFFDSVWGAEEVARAALSKARGEE